MALCLFLTAQGGFSHASSRQSASAWKPEIADHHAIPGRLIAVDKSSQKLSLLERHSPLAQTRQFICSTGRALGDKSVEGDLKTPEGIYFIVQHINSGLDFVKYGKEAFTLNYPNPVDRLRQKTGYGIWIHGRGEPIVPMQTEGCVAMINEDLAGLGKILVPGTPVALASSFSVKQGPVSKEDAEIVRTLEKRVREWAGAWASRSGDFFSFYDQNAYGLAQGEPFSLFKAQKQRLFKMLPWIKIEVSNIHVLEGPDYWVTWFQQDYSAPNLTSSGVRRLYWHKDKDGDFKILGMEWVPGLSTGTLLASAEPALPPLETTPRTEEQNSAAREQKNAVADEPKPDATAEKDADKAVLLASSEKFTPVATLDHVEDPSQGPLPEPLLAPYLLMLNSDDAAIPQGDWTGKTPRPGQETAKAGAPASSRAEDDGKTPVREVVELRKTASPAKETAEPRQAGNPARATAEAGQAAVPVSGTAGPQATKTPAAREDDSLKTMMKTLDEALQAAEAVPPPAPAARKAETDGSRPAGTETPAGAEEKSPPAPASVASEDKRTTDRKQEAQSAAPQTPASAQADTVNAPAAASGSPASGAPVPAGPGGSGPQAGDDGATSGERVTITFGPEGGQGEKTSAQAGEADNQDIAATVMEISSRIKEWGASWEAADVEGYMSFYAPNAVQGSRRGARSIQGHKENLWKRNKPATVNLNDIQVGLSGQKATARMIQEYKGSNGHSDTGYKTLELERINGVWLITREDWKAQPNG